MKCAIVFLVGFFDWYRMCNQIMNWGIGKTSYIFYE